MKKSFMPISILLLVCFLPINTFGGCIEGDCNNGHGILTLPDGEKLVGEFRYGEFKGK